MPCRAECWGPSSRRKPLSAATSSEPGTSPRPAPSQPIARRWRGRSCTRSWKARPWRCHRRRTKRKEVQDGQERHGKQQGRCFQSQSNHQRLPADSVQVPGRRGQLYEAGPGGVTVGVAAAHHELHHGFYEGLDHGWPRAAEPGLAAAHGGSPRMCRPLCAVHVQLVPPKGAHQHVVHTLQILRERHGLLCGALAPKSCPETYAGVDRCPAEAWLCGGLRQGLHCQAQERAYGADWAREARRCGSLQEQDGTWADEPDGTVRGGRCLWQQGQGGANTISRCNGHHGHVNDCHEEYEPHRRRQEGGLRHPGHWGIPHELPQGDGWRRLAVQGHQRCCGTLVHRHQPPAPAACGVHPQVRGAQRSRLRQQARNVIHAS
ncbi:unnamed protein product [Effrenium voratum]|uniref:Uncharacterized protein n=1 Tax=Effrenium voratum TaxID=2562239 RepID=A0AA36JLQ4_9DINO|nr:unnamed protein product [Effrenium voratum]